MEWGDRKDETQLAVCPKILTPKALTAPPTELSFGRQVTVCYVLTTKAALYSLLDKYIIQSL